MSEREIKINIKDFIYYTIGKWKLFILFAMVFAILCGGFGYWNKGRKLGTYEQAMQNYNSDIVSYNRQNAYYNLVNKEEEKLYGEAVAYNDTSKLMNMDVSNVTVDIVVYRLDNLDTKDAADSQNNMQNIYYGLANISANILRYVDWDYLEKELNLDRNSIRQLIEVSASYEELCVILATRWENKQCADIIMNEIISSFDKNVKNIKELDKFNVNREDIYTTVVPNEALFVLMQNNYNKLYEGLEKVIENDSKDMKKLVEPHRPGRGEFTRTARLKAGIKFAIVGIVLGILVCLIYVYEVFTRRGIIYSVNEYERISENLLLADFTAKNIEDEYERLFVNLSRVEGKKILFSIDASNEDVMTKSMETFNKVEAYLKDKSPKLKYEVVKNYISDNNALDKLAECDVVVEVYTLRDTTVSDVAKRNLFIKTIKKDIFGCVVV